MSFIIQPLPGLIGPTGSPGPSVTNINFRAGQLITQLSNQQLISAGTVPIADFGPLSALLRPATAMLFSGSNFNNLPFLGAAFLTSASTLHLVTAASNIINFNSPSRTVDSVIVAMLEVNQPNHGPRWLLYLTELIAYDGYANLAVLRITDLAPADNSDITPEQAMALLTQQPTLNWGSSRQLRGADPLALVGQPDGQDYFSLTTGYVREPRYGSQGQVEAVYFNLPNLAGNTGGPLVNREGLVVGVVSALTNPLLEDHQQLPLSEGIATAQVVAQGVIETIIAWDLAGQPPNPNFEANRYLKSYLGLRPGLALVPRQVGSVQGQLILQEYLDQDFLNLPSLLPTLLPQPVKEGGFVFGPNDFQQLIVTRRLPTSELAPSYQLTSTRLQFGTLVPFIDQPIKPGASITVAVWPANGNQPGDWTNPLANQIIPITEDVRQAFIAGNGVWSLDIIWLSVFVNPADQYYFLGVDFTNLYFDTPVDDVYLWNVTNDHFLFGLLSSSPRVPPSFGVYNQDVWYLNRFKDWQFIVSQTDNRLPRILPQFDQPIDPLVHSRVTAANGQAVSDWSLYPGLGSPLSTISMYQTPNLTELQLDYQDSADQAQSVIRQKRPLPLELDRPYYPAA